MYPQQQQGYPPQGYPVQPQYAQPPQQGYPTQQPQYTQPQPPASAPATAPVNTPRVGGAGSPSASAIAIWNVGQYLDGQLSNRLVAIMPLSIEQVPDLDDKNVQKTNPDGSLITKPRITADMMVFDGPPIQFGGRWDRTAPHHSQVHTPHLVTGMWIDQWKIIMQVKEFLPNPNAMPGTPEREGGIAVGRFYRGKAGQGSPPWLLTQPPNAASPQHEQAQWEADLNMVKAWWQDYKTGRFVNTVPGPITAPPMQQPQQYAQPGYGQPVPQQYPPQVQPYPMVQPSGYGQQAPPQQGYASPPAQPAPAPTGYAGPPPQQQAPNVDHEGVPSGWSRDVWFNMPQAQRDQIHMSMGVPVVTSTPPL